MEAGLLLMVVQRIQTWAHWILACEGLFTKCGRHSRSLLQHHTPKITILNTNCHRSQMSVVPFQSHTVYHRNIDQRSNTRNICCEFKRFVHHNPLFLSHRAVDRYCLFSVTFTWYKTKATGKSMPCVGWPPSCSNRNVSSETRRCDETTLSCHTTKHHTIKRLLKTQKGHFGSIS